MKKIVNWFTGLFHGGSDPLWVSIRDTILESNKSSRIKSMIAEILDTQPGLSNQITQVSGFLFGKGPKQFLLETHAFQIGENFWIARTADFQKYERVQIYICEDGLLPLEEATLVFDDGFLIRGTWENRIIDVLERALESAKTAKIALECENLIRDAKRANPV